MEAGREGRALPAPDQHQLLDDERDVSALDRHGRDRDRSPAGPGLLRQGPCHHGERRQPQCVLGSRAGLDVVQRPQRPEDHEARGNLGDVRLVRRHGRAALPAPGRRQPGHDERDRDPLPGLRGHRDGPDGRQDLLRQGARHQRRRVQPQQVLAGRDGQSARRRRGGATADRGRGTPHRRLVQRPLRQLLLRPEPRTPVVRTSQRRGGEHPEAEARRHRHPGGVAGMAVVRRQEGQPLRSSRTCGTGSGRAARPTRSRIRTATTVRTRRRRPAASTRTAAPRRAPRSSSTPPR